jgi:hypothetical protein
VGESGADVGGAMNRFFKAVAWSVLGVLGALLLVALAWVASNWHDAPAQPRPAVLALPTPQLPDEVNSFDALSQLHEGLPEVTAGNLLTCHARTEDCFSKWTKDVKALAAAREAHAAHGARCDMLVGEQFEYEERLPPLTSANTLLPAIFKGLATCGKWWLSAGVLAWARGDKPAAITYFVQSDRYQRALLAGSHSLIGLMVSDSIVRRSLQVFTAIALKDRTMAQSLLPLLAPLPDEVACAKRWIAVESAWQHSTMEEVGRSAELPFDEGQSVFAPLAQVLMRRGIAWHTNRTVQQADARWARWMAQLDHGLITFVRAQQQERARVDAQGWMASLRWRNTAGAIVLAVAEPAFLPYFARQADLELHRELAQLAIAAQAQGIAPAQRAEWSKTQTLSADNRARLTWSADGQVLSANTWEGEVSSGAAQNPERQTIRIEWPAINH